MSRLVAEIHVDHLVEVEGGVAGGADHHLLGVEVRAVVLADEPGADRQRDRADRRPDHDVTPGAELAEPRHQLYWSRIADSVTRANVSLMSEAVTSSTPSTAIRSLTVARCRRRSPPK